MTKPKVSVIIPFYNLGEYLDEAINSVLNQSFQDFEIIIVDDGSTDSQSIQKFQSYKNHQDSRIQIFPKENEKLPATRNYGIERSKGEYITCLDADDSFHQDFLKECVEVLDNNKKLGIATTWLKPFGDVLGKDTVVQIKKDDGLILLKNFVHVASMFRKKTWDEVKGYDESMVNGYEDWSFWLSIIEKGYNWEVIPKSLFNYRVRANSMLRKVKDKEDENYDYILQKHSKLIKQLDLKEVLKSARKTIFDYDLTINKLNTQKSQNTVFRFLEKLRNSGH